jgi:hypothetical protein
MRNEDSLRSGRRRAFLFAGFAPLREISFTQRREEKQEKFWGLVADQV